jgi:hypothetical protein
VPAYLESEQPTGPHGKRLRKDHGRIYFWKEPLTDNRDCVQKGTPELDTFILCSYKVRKILGFVSKDHSRENGVVSYPANPILLGIRSSGKIRT